MDVVESINTSVEECTWAEIRDEVLKADQTLCNLIDEVCPNNQSPFVILTYNYGAKIVSEGRFLLPNNEGSRIKRSLDSPSVPSKLKQQLSYSSMPVGLVLDKSVEVYYENGDLSTPTKLYTKGDIFGLWEMLDRESGGTTPDIWNISSGARSLFMLPKISDSKAHKRLKLNFGIKNPPPKRLFDHQSIFAELSDKDSSPQQWKCRILCFTSEWVELIERDGRFLPLQNYFYKIAWRQSQNTRKKMSFDLAWKNYIKSFDALNFKPDLYIVETIRHILNIADGVYPGFCPSDEYETTAPTKMVQETYKKDYQLHEYYPTIMHPHHLTPAGGKSKVYYSLAYPTLMSNFIRKNNSSSLLTDLRDIKFLLDGLSEDLIIQGEYKVHFEYFHTDTDRFNEIKPSTLMPLSDPALIGGGNSDSTRHNFATSSKFLRGCLSIQLVKIK